MLDKFNCLPLWGPYSKKYAGISRIADHEKYTKLGEIPRYAYENYAEMYNAYHALGGNGMVTKMLEEIDETDPMKRSLALSKKLREAGYILLFDPQLGSIPI